MTIEVKQLLVKSRVEPGENGPDLEVVRERIKQEIIAECRRMIQEFLRRQQRYERER